MKTIAMAAVAACLLGLSGCGDDNPAVGTWVVDVEGTVAAGLPKVLEKANEGMERERTKILEGAGENRWVAEAMLRPPEETKRLIEKGAREQLAARIGQMKMSMKIESGGGASFRVEMGGGVEEGTGAWVLAGDTLTLTPKTKNGKPVEGEDAKPQVFVITGDRMKPKGDDAPFVLRRT